MKNDCLGSLKIMMISALLFHKAELKYLIFVLIEHETRLLPPRVSSSSLRTGLVMYLIFQFLSVPSLWCDCLKAFVKIEKSSQVC